MVFMEDLTGMTIETVKECITGFIAAIKQNEKKLAALKEETEHEAALFENKAAEIKAEITELKSKVQTMIQQLPNMAAGERNKRDPGGEITFNDLEAALGALKTKLE
ncbi:hypothetical protein AGMMS50230_12950 [Spirochaetia bacterium]|nr:hypothetical protein AGMMS50230_12950 [Spirochaetia bacterium]